MVYVNIPFVIENNRIDRALATKELSVLGISDESKNDALAAIYSKLPRGVHFTEPAHAVELQAALSSLGVPYRQSEEPDYG